MIWALVTAVLAVGPSPATATGERDCASRVEGPAEVIAAAAPLRFWGGPVVSAPTEAVRRSRGGYGALKAGVDVAAGLTVTLSVAPRSRRRVALAYDLERLPRRSRFRLRDGQRAVTFTACAQDEPRFSGPGTVGPRTGFNGGFIAAGRQCARLRVRVDGESRTRSLRVGIGRRCR